MLRRLFHSIRFTFFFSVICTRAEGTRVLSGMPALKAAGCICVYLYVRVYYIIVPFALPGLRSKPGTSVLKVIPLISGDNPIVDVGFF